MSVRPKTLTRRRRRTTQAITKQRKRNKQNNLKTTSYRKPTDQQSYLHTKLKHPGLLKNGIATFRIKTVCSTGDELQKNCAIIEHKILKKKHN